MAQKPNHASGYGPAQVEHVRATCLNIATKLGDFLDEIVIVGGLVPSLLIDQAAVTVPDRRRLQAWLTLRRAACSQRSNNAAGSRVAASMRARSSSIDWAGGVAGGPSCADTPPPSSRAR